MTPPLLDEDNLQATAQSHPVPNEIKLEGHLNRLINMRAYYDVRYQEAEEDHKKLFLHIDNALAYSMTVIKLYRQLTRRVAALAAKEKK